MPVLHVVIPCYNEGATVVPCVQRVLAAVLPDGWSRSLVVVDDHSDAPDRDILRDMVATLESQGHPVELCRHGRNQGKGAALRTGFDTVLAVALRTTILPFSTSRFRTRSMSKGL